MKHAASPVPTFPAARQGISHPVPREHTPTALAQVTKSTVCVEKRAPERGPVEKEKIIKARPKGRIPLRAPNIWEDAWEHELDHPTPNAHGPTLNITAPSNETGRSVVVFEEPKPPIAVPGSGRPLSESPLKRILTDINARAMTPREMRDLSLDLYINGILTWDEHVELAFQAELHPDFERTIGALTGEKPLPDQPRDYVCEWERRLDFERRFAPAKSHAKDRALHILSVLRRIERPASLLT